MKIHKWSEPKASAARGNLGYSKKRKLLSPSKQQRTKPRIYKRQQCPMTGCFKEPLRLQNRLRQTHKIIDKSALNELMQRAVKSLEDGQFMSESEYSSSVDETDNEDELIKRMGCEEFNKENDMYEEGSDGDTEWLAENCTNLLVERCHEKNLVLSSECSFSDSEDEGIVEEPENPNESDEDEYDYEDLDDKLYMTNQEADEVLLRFTNWLISDDGGTKPPIQA